MGELYPKNAHIIWAYGMVGMPMMPAIYCAVDAYTKEKEALKEVKRDTETDTEDLIYQNRTYYNLKSILKTCRYN